MITLKFALNEVIDVATHAMFSPRKTLRPTYDQSKSAEPVYASLWWVRDGSGTYLTGNSTHKKAPRDAYAEGYGPDGGDASDLFGGDSRVIDAIPLHDPATRACLHSDLLRAQRAGHNTLTITLTRSVVKIRTGHRPVPVVPYGLTAYTRGIVLLAHAKDLHLTWKTGKVKHLLHLAAPGPHGVKGHVIVGARSGKVLRAALSYPSHRDTIQIAAEGTNAVRELLAGLSPSPCTPGCTGPDVDAYFNRALQ
ncbi:hypothetical protein ABR737_01345 [Streptomyces sp. Edi2]|uniref:hypothetical protein n=1 Tax=Streptomyces sp. Edi2 TaxID=3162528 RepID=UPI00330657DD